MQTTKYNIAEHLTAPDFQADYPAEAFETGDDCLIRRALGVELTVKLKTPGAA